MTERKYTSHSAKECTGVRTSLYIKYGLGGPMGSRTDAMKQYKKSENKWNKELKALKKQNKIICSIAKKSGSHHDIKLINETWSKDSKKNSDSYSNDSD